MEEKIVSNESIKKVLPVKYPMVTTYTQHAHLLSILSNYEYTYPWIFSNYIQLYINKDFRHDWGDFYFPFPYELRPSDTCKWLLTKKIDRDVADSKWGNIINFIIDSINSNNYVHTMLNSSCIPLAPNYNKEHFIHDVLVYGYDLKEEMLYFSDFIGVTHKYSFEKISFIDYTKAFNTYGLATNQDYLNKLIYLYKLNSAHDYTFNYDYEFNIKNISNSIKAYLNSSVPEYWDIYNNENRDNIVFGIEIYDTLKNYIAWKSVSNESDIDIRPFYLVYDHKKIMLLRLEYLHRLGYYKDCSSENIAGITELEAQAKVVVNMLIKYNLSKNRTILNMVIDMINSIERDEKNILVHYT